MVTIPNWTIELAQVDSSEVFTSYAGLEMRFIVHNFELRSTEQVKHKTRYPTNLYRDDQTRTFIHNFIYKQQKDLLDSNIASK